MLSRLVITFLPRSKCLLISWLQSPSAVILEPRKIKSATASTVSPSICYEVMGPDAMILVFWMLSFKQTFSLSFFTFMKRLFSSSSLSAIRVVSSAYLCIRWPKYWSFSFSISPSNEYSGLISFRIDWFDLLASPRDSQESSPAPQFESINSLVSSLLYGPTLTTLGDYWENQSFD